MAHTLCQSRLPRRLAAAGLALSAICLAPSARAQDIADPPPPQSLGMALRQGLTGALPFWRGSGPWRPFAAASLDAGVVFFRPTLQLGYGKPHWQWFGLEAYAAVNQSAGSEYVGIAGALPNVSARAGLRYDFPVNQRLLPRLPAYNREDLQHQQGPRSRYVVAEAEIAGAFMIPGGAVLGVLTGYAMPFVRDGYNVFEESLRVVVEPPFVWRGRLGYLYDVDSDGTMRIGMAAEVIHIIERGSVVVRSGPALSIRLTHHLDAIGAAMIVVESPDRLGLVGADFGQIGLRYRWATGDNWAEFP